MRTGAIFLAALLAGCAATPRPVDDYAGRPASIRYETSPCFGFCPVYSVRVWPDGTGEFDGQRHTAVSGKRRFTLATAQYDAFARALSPWLPTKGEVRIVPGTDECGRSATDLPGVEIEWRGLRGATRDLDFYYGCDMQKYAAMAAGLRKAPEALPIADLIGKR